MQTTRGHGVAKVVRKFRLGEEPSDFWSQSFCYGSVVVPGKDARSVQIRFRNDGGKKYLRAEAHLVYWTSANDATKVTFAWTDDTGDHPSAHTATGDTSTWTVPTGRDVRTRWVEFEAVSR